MIEHIIKPNKEVLDEIGRLRFTIWARLEPDVKIAYPNDTWLEEADNTSEHWIIRNPDTMEIIAAARLSVSGSAEDIPYGEEICALGQFRRPYGLISRLVVSENWQKRGMANSLDAVRINRARDVGVKTLFAIADEWRAKKLLNKGFQVIGDSFPIIPWRKTLNIPLALHIRECENHS